MILVGLGYERRVGKDTVADRMVENHGFTKVPFAEALYEETHQAFTVTTEPYQCSTRVTSFSCGTRGDIITRDNDYGCGVPALNALKVWLDQRVTNPHEVARHRGPSGRTTYHFPRGMVNKDGLLLQWWGTDFRRALFGDEYWLARWGEKAFRHARVVVPDCRFLNEVDIIRDNGGEYWRVWSDTKHATDNDNRSDEHPSEVELRGVSPDAYIANSYSLDQLFEQVDALTERLVSEASGR